MYDMASRFLKLRFRTERNYIGARIKVSYITNHVGCTNERNRETGFRNCPRNAISRVNVRKRGSAVGACFVIFVLVAFPNLVIGSDDLKKRFLTEAPEAWRQNGVKLQLTSFQRDIESSYTLSSGEKRSDKFRTISLRRGSNVIREFAQLQNGKVTFEHARGINDRYKFYLLRPGPDSIWSISFILPPSDDAESTSFLTEIDVARDELDSGLRSLLYGLNLARIQWDDSRVTIRECREVTRDGLSLCQVEIQFNSRQTSVDSDSVANRDWLPERCRSLHLIVDPEKKWLPVFTRLVVEPPSGTLVSEVEWTYELHRDGYLPTKLVERRMFSERKGVDEYVHTDSVTDVSSEPIHNERFTLLHYGLPEPDWSQRSLPWWLYLIICGFALVLGAMILSKVKRAK